MEKVIKLLAKYYPVYLSGLWGTLWISAVTVLSGALLGMLVALMRMSRSKLLNGIAGAYVEILRGTPILLQLYFFWIGPVSPPWTRDSGRPPEALACPSRI